MTAITTIRIPETSIPQDFQDADRDITAAKIEAQMRDFGVVAEVSDVMSHFKIEVQTVHLANACAALVVMGLLTPLNLAALKGN
jgi:hypothetical protein